MSGKVSHGNTPAAWTGTLLILIGAACICVGLVAELSWLWIGGVVITVAGVVAWIGMNRAGMTHDLF
ncbi:hypothetical protein KEM60_02612 [Austwickia sp. TVS 96-490-7B]|uniref:HGxxPAAW family protein n=1 Tax=Austwickia sp. TVS 96-490-7B TaxID=2830843 RepID=UPI001C59FB7A|nr:HGxxPAAW family protein [Austwickia sp. TVS 96-490-7B]MBW3086394.1 hypothetical protein [Austwickia sp. TVS 96-490-7B]